MVHVGGSWGPLLNANSGGPLLSTKSGGLLLDLGAPDGVLFVTV